MATLWIEKAHQRIAALCMDAYKKANKGRKKHVPYVVPIEARELVECISKHDEERAKAIFIHGFCDWTTERTQS